MLKIIRPRDKDSAERSGLVVRRIRTKPGAQLRYYAGQVFDEWPEHVPSVEEQILVALADHHTPITIATHLNQPRKSIAALLCSMRKKGLVEQRHRGVWYAT